MIAHATIQGFLSLQEAAKHLGCKERMVRVHVRRGRLRTRLTKPLPPFGKRRMLVHAGDVERLRLASKGRKRHNWSMYRGLKAPKR